MKTINKSFLYVFILFSVLYKAQIVQTFSYTGSIQTFTVPSCVSLFTIQANGAQGGGSFNGGGGLGARMIGTFSTTAGAVYSLVVGQMGLLQVGGQVQNSSGGGGGSFVYSSVPTLLIAAGGGGGKCNYTNSSALHTGAAGTISAAGNQASAGGAAGGLASLGGNAGLWSNVACAGGGTGWSGVGGGAYGGLSFPTWAGGPGYCAGGGGGCGGVGGYGGGGGGGNLYGGGGGGGGYSGGGGGTDPTHGGGGGSFNIGSNQSNTSGAQSGNGSISITYNFNGNGVVSGATPSLICSGSSTTLNALGMLTYSWSTGSNLANVVVTPTTTTSYTVQGTNSVNCISSAVITVTVNNAVPSLSILNSTNSICPTNTVILTAAGAINYTWTGGVSNGVAFSPLATSNYTVSGSNGCGTSTALTSVTVTPLPVIGISTSSAVCAGNTATLSAGGALTYTWMPGNLVGPSVVVSPLVSTIYTLTGTTPACAGVYTLSLIAKPNPTVTTSASNSLICAGAQVTLTAFGASTYTWQSGPTVSSSLVVSPTAPTAYQVSGTNSLGCTSNSTQVVIVNPSPIINVIASETLICAGGSSTLTASGGSNYTWNFGPTTAAVVVSPTANTVYSVTSIGVGCNTTQTISVDVFTQTLTVSNSTAICLGSSVTLNASGGTTYLWSNGGTGSSIFVYPSVSTLYTVSAVTVINNMSCNSTGSVNLTINPNPTVTAVLTRSVICRGESTILTANGANTYVWNNTATTPSFAINPIINTNYTVTGTNLNGCKGTGTVQIKVNTCTGISEINKEKGIKIYPNPNNGDFTIESQLAIDLLIINELGQTIKTIQLSSANNLQLKVSDLSNGIYFIVGKNKTTNINQKIIVNK